jgi:hypothetical protein
MIVARGLAPVPPDEALELLVKVSGDEDSDIAGQAAATLDSWAEAEILSQLQSRNCALSVLEYFARRSAKPALLEAVVLNPATPGEVVEELAPRAPVALLETILFNRVRLLEHPGILQKVKLNPAATPEVQRLIHEIEREFFEGKKTEYSVETPSQPAAPQVEEFEIESEEAPADLSLEGLPTNPEEREGALADRLARMTVRQKIQLALLGTREVRTILIRDTNKEVARNVLQSPKLTDNEIEGFAAMRNISEDVLREIGSSKAWTRGYGVVQNLVRNPKTPPLVSQRLMIRLQNKDLQLLSRDRGISELVRRSAQRILSQRTAPKKTG